MSIRHSIFLMGPSGTGKSECWKNLAGARIKQGDKATIRDLDPKAILTTDFYGYVNLATREWKDGMICYIIFALPLPHPPVPLSRSLSSGPLLVLVAGPQNLTLLVDGSGAQASSAA